MEEARKKIEAEMAAHAADASIQRIGNFLIMQLNINPSAAPAIMAKGKTVMGSFNAMRDEAQKHHRNGNSATLTDEEGFNMVLGYFGIVAQAPAPESIAAAPAMAAAAPRSAFDVTLDDLLEGL